MRREVLAHPRHILIWGISPSALADSQRTTAPTAGTQTKKKNEKPSLETSSGPPSRFQDANVSAQAGQMFSSRGVLAEPGHVHGAHGNTCVNTEMEVASARDALGSGRESAACA